MQPLIIPGQEHNTEGTDPIDLPSPQLKPDFTDGSSVSKPEMEKLWRQNFLIFQRSVVLLSRLISRPPVHREFLKNIYQLNQFQRTVILSLS